MLAGPSPSEGCMGESGHTPGAVCMLSDSLMSSEVRVLGSSISIVTCRVQLNKDKYSLFISQDQCFVMFI